MKFLQFIGIFSIITIVVLIIARIVFGISFSMNCTQYLKRAADANTIELAKDNLSIAIKYLEENNLTDGIVSIFIHQPENDINFFYSNLRSSQDELSKVTSNTSQMEKSNLLMKLRETLIDHDKEGTAVTCPNGISIYPYNKLYFWSFVILSFLSCCILPEIIYLINGY